MLNLTTANGNSLRATCTAEEFVALVAAASPSPWISVELEGIGSVALNTFIVAYFYEDPE